MDSTGIHALLTFLLMSTINVSKSSPHPKPIVNGKAARNNRFPFAVAFSLKPESSAFFCCGTLISQNLRFSWAISAAHCFLDLKNQTVFARTGGGDLNSTSDGSKWLKVLKIISANLNIYTMQNDIALVRIEAKSVGHQQVIRRSIEFPSSKSDCLIYGYGSLSYQSISVTSSTIRYGKLSPISYKLCEETNGRISAPQEGTGQFCALGRNGVDACNGDSGSGLICRGAEGLFELVGVVSHGSGCGEGTAGVYESLAYHQHWIDSNIRQTSFLP